jgi:hypothetical protein
MPKKPSIPMSPSQLPQQRLHEVVELEPWPFIMGWTDCSPRRCGLVV